MYCVQRMEIFIQAKAEIIKTLDTQFEGHGSFKKLLKAQRKRSNLNINQRKRCERKKTKKNI